MAVITISRQYGAGGKTMGDMIAKKLGYAFLDHDLLQKVAEKAKVSKEWVQDMEKEAGGKLLKFINILVSKNQINRILDKGKGYIDEEIYVDTLNHVINKIADEGNAVILGRGSQYILKDRKDAYHVLLIAERADRIRFMEMHYQMSAEQATQAVNSEDKRRINLYHKFGKQDYDQPGLYHLTLNMSKISLGKGCELVCNLMK
ncbi:MAG: cytidylate kinase-like family protein [Desulfobacteraceae bacterium]|nr:cytidylate kinase-like family protein [Desulfobacteraceae bacterium]